MTEAEQIAQQARTYTAHCLRISRLERRVTDQQHIIDKLNAENDELRAQLTPQAQAERHFT